MKKNLVIVFDLDGTLLNTDLLIHKSFQYTFDYYKPGYILSDDEQKSFLGPTLHDSFIRYFDEETVKKCIEIYREYNYIHHIDYVTMYDSVEETLKVLKEKGYTLVVLTTKMKDMAIHGLTLFHLIEYFDLILGLEEVEHVKPNPEGLLKAMDFAKVHQAIMVGDNVSDLMAAKNANVYSVGVNWSSKKAEMEAIQPDCMLDKMSDLIHFVERKENKC